jgi:hypothetical protein
MKKKLQKEIEKCRDDFEYFCSKYLKIVDKNGKLVLLAYTLVSLLSMMTLNQLSNQSFKQLHQMLT